MKYLKYKKFLSLYKEVNPFIKEVSKGEIFKDVEKAIFRIVPDIQIPNYKVYEVSQFILWERTAWYVKYNSIDCKILENDIFVTRSLLIRSDVFVVILHEIIHTLGKEKFANESMQEFFIHMFAIWITINDGKYELPKIMKPFKGVIDKVAPDIRTCFERYIMGDISYLEKEYQDLRLRVKLALCQ